MEANANGICDHGLLPYDQWGGNRQKFRMWHTSAEYGNRPFCHGAKITRPEYALCVQYNHRGWNDQHIETAAEQNVFRFMVLHRPNSLEVLEPMVFQY